jgi:putative membrane protein
MTRGELGDNLALINATLNATSGMLLVLGRRAIKAGKRETHKKLMLATVGTSAVFLASYLTRVALTGTHADPHAGAVHVLYLAILLTHMTLASAVPVLAIILLVRAFKGRFAEHRALARYTYPIWLYVSVTGVIVYLMLYHLPV